MFSKLKKLIFYISHFDVIKSAYAHFTWNVTRSASIHIYPSSIIDVASNANVSLFNGELAINRSWFNTRKRKYRSEFRILSNGRYEQYGRVDLYQGASIHVGENAILRIKGNCFLNTNAQILCFNEISIGQHVYISDNVCIVDSDSHCIDGRFDQISSPVTINDNVWIGMNVTILKGVEIGEGTVIGACSVVTTSIPSHCLAVGSPARVIRNNIVWE